MGKPKFKIHSLERWCYYIPNVGYVKFQSDDKSVIHEYPDPRGLYVTRASCESVLCRKIAEAQKTQHRNRTTFHTTSHGAQWLNAVSIRKVFVALQVETETISD